jgi:hypothetical protein
MGSSTASAASARNVEVGRRLPFVRLDDDTIQCFESPVIEALKLGQGLGRVSTLEAVALFLSAAAEALVKEALGEEALGEEALGEDQHSRDCYHARLIETSETLHRSLGPLVDFLRKDGEECTLLRSVDGCAPSDTADATEGAKGASEEKVRLSPQFKAWTTALRAVAKRAPAPHPALQQCCICGEHVKGGTCGMAQHVRGRGHCEKVALRLLQSRPGCTNGPESVNGPESEAAAAEVLAELSTAPLAKSPLEPPDVAAAILKEALDQQRHAFELEQGQETRQLLARAAGLC